MLDRQNTNIYYYINFKKINSTLAKWNLKKLNFKNKLNIKKNNKRLKIINTCLLTGKRKSVLNKNKINRHYIRDIKKKDFNYWSIKNWKWIKHITGLS